MERHQLEPFFLRIRGKSVSSLPTPVLPKRLPHGPHPPATAARVSPLLLEASAGEPDAVLQRLRTSKGGLSDDEAGRRLRATGPNVVAGDERHPRTRLLRKALQGAGHFVGFLGDGINDAPAFRAVDVGIPVDTATDIAKESADVILMEKDLLVLEEGVREGRKVFANILKYVRMGASSNFGNRFSVLGASVFLPFVPMAPIQILTNNLLSAITGFAAQSSPRPKGTLMPKNFDSTAPVRSAGSAQPARRVLTVNGGSSSIKFALFESGQPPVRRLAGAVERIGLADAFLRATGRDRPDERRPFAAADLDEAVAGLLNWLDGIGELGRVAAIGYRIVHGGSAHSDPQVVTPELLSDLRQAVPLAPAHLPAEIRLIEALSLRLSGVPQVVCFDTAFHRDLPSPARLLPVPRRYRDAGVRRYGFHGLSYAYLLGEFERLAGPDAARGRVVFAHLGSGASMAAVRGGQCIDTTMGLTPAGGLVMGTRTGDLDPGVLVFLARSEGLSADQLDDLVTRRSGLLGISETSADMQDLLARQGTDARAADAVEMFCYQARKLGPSNKTEPVLSRKAEPLGPAGVVGSARRARVAQLGTPVRARSEVRPGVVA